MTDGHFTPERTMRIVDENNLEGDELAHVKYCKTCNEWLRAFAKLSNLAGKPLGFQIPPPPDSN